MVNVRKKKNIQTLSCRPSVRLSDLQLNKSEGSSSVVNSKTLSNPSRESRKPNLHLAEKVSRNGTCSPKHSASKEDFVFVLNKNGEALMPTKSGKARRMLKSGIAKVVSHTPFVIKMSVETCEYKQQIDAGMDTGSKNIGVSAKVGPNVVYLMHVLLRQKEIKSKMEQRSMYRRTRRSRKTRYRKPRFLNRGASISKGRLSPSVKHVVQAHFRERDFVNWILPVNYVQWNLELASFDIHKITNPAVTRFDYSKGRQKGFYNVRAFVLQRDSHFCQKCDGKKKCEKLHVHHIVFRSNGGSDSPDNLVTLCESCHNDLHTHKDAEKESLKLRKSVRKNTKDATQVSIVASQLRKFFGEFKETFGYETKFKRELSGFKKSHHIDAVFIASTDGEMLEIPKKHLFKRLVSSGDYRQTSGTHSGKKIPTGKLFGFRKFDFIETDKGVGFVKGKRSSGYFALSDIHGKVISNSINVKKNAKRLSARKTVLTQTMEECFLPDLKDGVSALKIR